VVTAKVAQQESSRTRLRHLVNFKFEQPLKDVAVRIRIPEGMRVREVVKTPDEAAGRRVEFSVTSANVSLRVSRPGAYALALVRMAAK
jgi:hypothetical protein